MRDHLLIHVNGRRHPIRGERALQSLTNFLRYDLGLTGTKVVCAEGDCGSCAVLIGRADATSDTISYRPVTACIQFLYQLDGAHVVTIEGLRGGEELNPVQEAMVRCHGAQCGFCTPGFVVSLCGMLEEQPSLTEPGVRHGLSGNLCRCTGYEPIIRAALEAPTDRVMRANQLYPPETLIPELRRAATEPVRIDAGPRILFKPTSVADATRFKSEQPDCVVVAGGTDVGVQVNKGSRDPRSILSLAGLSELASIALDDGTLIVGALATLGQLERRTEQLCPDFARMLWRHGSPLVRSVGTLAGNIANASPIGDTMPALFVLDAHVELTGVSGSRRVNINDFYSGYRKTVLAADELITRVLIPLPRPRDDFRLYKVSKRHDLDISTFTAAFWMRRQSGVAAEVRIAYGGCGPVIYRLRKTEAALTGRPFTEAEVESAAAIARREIAPISDVRGAADYRLQLSENIVRKFYADVAGEPTYQRATDPGRTPAAARFPGNGNGDGKAD